MGRAVYSLSTTHELCQLAVIGQTALEQGFAGAATKPLRALCMKRIVHALQITNLNKTEPPATAAIDPLRQNFTELLQNAALPK
ncbi:hypothetical protein [Pseudomonas granadensis]|uniref:hypothetical protein n=1 Tax=Pseudomonas granadensis TaxID=1421430 RepID=UPI0008797CAF|nr:hypothetical protein [Pseudomonas granadensis]SDT19760.1 hypothetical protein SAMN05216579_2792 [Pseudomonas granadensis]